MWLSSLLGRHRAIATRFTNGSGLTQKAEQITGARQNELPTCSLPWRVSPRESVAVSESVRFV